jgi:lysozyme
MRAGAEGLKGCRRRAGVAGVIVALAVMVAATALAQTVPYNIPGATAAAASLIAGFEGFCPGPYNDTQPNCGTGGTSGNCTIGYGTELHSGACTAADTAAYPNGITRQQALNMLQNDANAAANAVDNHVTVPLTANQRDALTSFVYNTGTGAFAGSTLLRDLNAGNTQAAADQFSRWINSNGSQNQGLINRRGAERCYFLRGSTTCTGQVEQVLLRLALAPMAVVSSATGHRRPKPSLSLSSRGPRAGKTVSFRGSGWQRGAVKIVALVPGVSPYRKVVLRAKAARGGRFVIRWRVSRHVIDTLRWRLTATQSGSGHRSATVRVVVKGNFG